MKHASFIIIFFILTLLPLTLRAQQDTDTTAAYSLKLQGVEVTAERRTQTGTTSYVMGRAVLDHAQIINLSDITQLLPGGKTVNATLMDDSRLSLRSAQQEMGNAAFGTAIEVDGMRLDNNGMMSETTSASTRSISSANIGQVEVVTGIAGVEYGDVSNGIVRITPRRGLSPWIVEGAINPYTRQISLSKGIGHFNLSVEHANSFSNTASPYTSYQRNNIYIGYNNQFHLRNHAALRLHAGLTANIGGYNSEADPDAFVDTYTKVRDNNLRMNTEVNYQTNNALKLTLTASYSVADKLTESYQNSSSSSSQPYLHTTTDGYYIAQDYDCLLQEGLSGKQHYNGIILGPTGYWYVRQYNAQKPQTLSIKLKGQWTANLGHTASDEDITNRLLLGTEYTATRNSGQGTYYEDLRLAPTWRPYDYSQLPALRCYALFAEDRLDLGFLQLTAGLRSDITSVAKSAYGTVSTLSPRFTARYIVNNHLTLHAGWGKSVKLPSFQVLYPTDSYTDKLAFTPGSTSNNRAYYAYYTHVQRALYNKDLRWQYTNQTDLGVELRIGKARFSVSAYLHRTHNPYQQVSIYTPFTYNFTSQEALNGIGIPADEQTYDIDHETGLVTVHSPQNATCGLQPTPHNTYLAARQYVNGSTVSRYGLEWIADLPLSSDSHLVGMTLRLDGNYYHYHGTDHTLFAGSPNGIGDYAATSAVPPLIGYYAGSNVTSASTAATPSVSNGALQRGLNLNATLTARIPRLRLIMTLKVESTLHSYRRQLSEERTAILLAAAGEVAGTPYHGESDSYVALYPEYYSTWDNPTERIPFAAALMQAQQDDPALYQQLCRLIVRSNTAYYFNPNRLSAYYSCNLSVTKEIGNHISLSFYANNFLNTMQMITSSQTGLQSSLFNSGYVPSFYYGASLRIKI